MIVDHRVLPFPPSQARHVHVCKPVDAKPFTPAPVYFGWGLFQDVFPTWEDNKKTQSVSVPTHS